MRRWAWLLVGVIFMLTSTAALAGMSYPIGSAGDALSDYLEGWELQIWDRMADYTTEEFQARNPDTVKFFADNYGVTTLNSGNILEVDERGDSFAVAKVHLIFKGWTGDLINKKIKVTLKTQDGEWRIIDPTIFYVP